MRELSGAQWCARFPTGHSLDDLVEPFKSNAKRFVAAVQAAGASISIGAVYRPTERAYLMHWAWAIARLGQDPATVPSMQGVDIEWNHSNAGAAAEAMVEGYSMAYTAALVSRHTQRRAIDITVHWAGTINVRDARDISHPVRSQEDLWPIGASYGVNKLPSDPPHWSDDGH